MEHRHLLNDIAAAGGEYRDALGVPDNTMRHTALRLAADHLAEAMHAALAASVPVEDVAAWSPFRTGYVRQVVGQRGGAAFRFPADGRRLTPKGVAVTANSVVVLDRIEPGQPVPDYCIHGRATCVGGCGEWVWLGSETVKLVESGRAQPVCRECVRLLVSPDVRLTGHVEDHRRADGPHG
jgi:hypothetical protein